MDVPSAPFFLKNDDRVVFYGDSITENGGYTNDVETFVRTRFPRLRVSFANAGWGGDKVSGGDGGSVSIRLKRDVLAYKPTVMTVMLGMNDGRYRVFEEDLFKVYSEGYLSLIDTVTKSAPDIRFTLIIPSPYDDVSRPEEFPGGYNNVLIKFGDFVRQTAGSRFVLADFNAPLVEAIRATGAKDSLLAQKIIPDRVHPARAGHLIMAAALLKAWNAPALVSAVTIDANRGKVLEQQAATVSQLSLNKGISWIQLDQSLPFPVDRSDSLVEMLVHSSDLMKSLNRQILCVKGLSAGCHTLTIDDIQVGTFDSAELANGINLASFPSPMQEQAARVAVLTQARYDKQMWRWRRIQVQLPQEADGNPAVSKLMPELLDALQATEARIIEEQYKAAQPRSHEYRLTPAP